MIKLQSISIYLKIIGILNGTGYCFLTCLTYLYLVVGDFVMYMYFIAYQFCRSMKPCIHSISEFKFNHLNHISQVFPCVLNISNRNTYTHTYTQLKSQFKPFHKAATYLRAYFSMMSNQHHIH